MKFDLKLAAFCLMFAVSAIASLALLGSRAQELQNIAVSLAVAAGGKEILCRLEARDDAIQKIEFS